MEKVRQVSKRILTFDLMRGWFLLAITINHIAFFPNGLGWISGRGGLYVTTAEGFFLVSGIVLGIVRGAKTTREAISASCGIVAKAWCATVRGRSYFDVTIHAPDLDIF